MKKTRKILSLLLAVVMLFSITACNDNGGNNNNNNTGNNNNNNTGVEGGDNNDSSGGGGRRKITIGTWFDIFYVSKHTSIYDDPKVAEPETAQLMLDNLRVVEERYNIELDFINLTFEGIQESITTSILAGRPDCDIYMMDIQFGIPAALSGLGTSLESMELQDTDVFNEQRVMEYLNVGQDETYLFNRSIKTFIPNYPLAFNMNMILEKNLENPQDLWDRGEWTWDKWREYLIALTDTNSGVFGWSGYWTNMLENLLFSNGASIAAGPETTVTSIPTVQTFALIYDIYNVDKSARPWNESDWVANNNMYAEGKSGFWVGADWIFDEQGSSELPFDIGIVPWPVGPSGNKDTNFHGGASANWYMIPRGVEDPRFVYDVIFDWINWYDYDLETAEDLEWSQNLYMTERNFDYAYMMSKNRGFDIWNSLGLGDDFSMIEIMNGEKNASQYAEEVKQIIQDALDGYFK